MKMYKNMTLALPSEIAEKLEKISKTLDKSKRSLVIQSIEQYLTLLEIELNTTQSIKTIPNQSKSNPTQSNNAKLLREFQEFQNSKTTAAATYQTESNIYETDDNEDDEEE